MAPASDSSKPTTSAASNGSSIAAQVQAIKARKSRSNTGRRLLLACVAAYYVVKTFHKELWPWGRPLDWPGRKAFQSMDYDNNGLQLFDGGKMRKVLLRTADGIEPTEGQRLLKGTETIVIDKEGDMYGMTEEGNLLAFMDVETVMLGGKEGFKYKILKDLGNIPNSKLQTTANVLQVRDLGIGRPLGGAFGNDGTTLWMADAILGLTRLQNPKDPASKVELIANSVTLEDGRVSKFLYTNDVVVGPVSGKVYFTDSSTVAPTRVKYRTWDTLYAAKTDIFRAKPTGRVLEYDPNTDKVRVLATGLHFANGIGVNGDESYLVINETAAMRISKLHLKGEKAGQVEVLVSDLPGYPDGLTCSPAGQCFSVMPSSIVPLHKLTAKLPDFMDVMLRHLLLALPRKLAPKVKPFGGLVHFDGATGEHEYYLDPEGKDVSHFAGATYNHIDGKVYLGSLTNEYIGLFKPFLN